MLRKRPLLLGRKVMTNLDSILKSRDIALPKKVYLVKAMVFPVVMYGCESWTIKKSEHERFNAFELWCWRRLLRVPWTARRSNQSILKDMDTYIWASQVAQWKRNHLQTRNETQVQPLVQEDPLEKEMASCSSILAWEIPWTEESGRLQSTGS